MNWYHWISIFALATCLVSLLFHIVKLIRLGSPEDFAEPGGSIKGGIKYSFTGAMSPKKKESAYLHLPTYTAGLLYHAGTFLAILIFLISFFINEIPAVVNYLIIGILVPSSISGLGILVKRASKSLMRKLSNPDDYLSNLLVTVFQIATVLFLGFEGFDSLFYYLIVSALLLYIPIGKLKHLIYFFAARFHLGWFYGHRGTWPPKEVTSD